MYRRNHRRRGVILLITLSLLILFLLIGITYLLTSSQFMRSAVVAARVDQVDDLAQTTCNYALWELLRGSNNQQSSISAHSIFENLYGDVSAYGTIQTFSDLTNTGGQFKTLTVGLIAARTKVPNASLGTVGFFNGCILTVVDGPAAGSSARVVGYMGDSQTFWIMPLDTDIPVSPVAGNHVLINGRQFSGTGPGFNTGSGITDGALALFPNCATNANYLTQATLGGMNPDYTAADYNTMFLAYRPAGTDTSVPSYRIIPSFHRPALLNYFSTNGGLTDDVLRRACLRPCKADHPVFNATVNPAYNPINGPWDVDNDGDGIPDSIWIDPGFPPMSHKDGRIAKVLVAYHVLDMEGRVNLNAHGSTGLTNGTGLGLGPAEINLSKAITAAEAGKIYSGRGSPTATATTAPYAYKFFEYPADYYNGAASGFRSFPPDINGTGSIAVNTRGLPTFSNQMGQAGLLTSPTNPYLANLSPSIGRNGSTPVGGNTLFTAAEFEAFLRSYDIDARTLPTRLTKMVNPLGLTGTDQKRFSVGIDGIEIPGPVPLPIEDMRNKYGKNHWALHIVDLLRAKLGANGVTGAAANKQMQVLLPPELVAGLKMNINRSDTAVNLNDDVAISNPKFYRQIEARHLYVLMMLLTDAGYLQPVTEAGLSQAQQQELTAQRLAQWAINVCAFKDTYDVMVPFEYMVNPFAGWALDGDPATNEGGGRRIVWSCEYPDLLLMGSLAFHDRRVKDTTNDDGKSAGHTKAGTTLDDKANNGKNKDPDMDQVRIPQGSLFFKLYCPGNQFGQAGNKPPQEIYTNNSVDLERTTPDGAYPVWRVVISTSTSVNKTAPTSSDVLGRLANKPNTTSFQPERMSLLETAAVPTDYVNIERIVWFTPKAKINPAGNPDAAKIFYSQNPPNSNLLPAGAYALIGPRTKTWIGSKNDGTASAQTIDLSSTTASTAPYALVAGSASTTPAGIQAPLTIICGANPPAGWAAGGPSSIGLNVSEPMPQAVNYYKQPTQKWPNSPYPYNDAYGVDGDTNNPYPDAPFDSQAGMPLKVDNMLATGTYLNVRTMFLQRLANPLDNYNKDTNPYLTIDWMPVDLTVFNGENQNPDPNSTVQDPDDPTPGKVANAPVAFAERMRGKKTPPGTATPTDLFWNAISDNPGVLQATTYPDGSSNNFGCKLVHSFAFLNLTYGTPGANGDPPAPFPWLAWNNRPFVSAQELMLVPASTPGRLTSEFSLPTMQTAPAAGPYDPGNTANYYPYGHLLNFFQSNTVPADNPAPAPAAPAPEPGNFFRLFDYVGVPSPFVGTETWFDTGTFNLPYFRPPFNYVSNYREPGKVNLNTINGPSVLAAVLNGYPAPTWANFQSSRAGYAITTFASENNAASPTNFAGAFRSAVGADMVPLPALRRDGVQATILRSDWTTKTIPLFSSPSTANTNNTNRNPYFAYQGIDRISNLTTTRSNVFAVWLTVGYFEILPNGSIGAEIGSDTGDTKRHRAFYLIDRSVPVGFERGYDYNINKAILLQRYIE